MMMSVNSSIVSASNVTDQSEINMNSSMLSYSRQDNIRGNNYQEKKKDELA